VKCSDPRVWLQILREAIRLGVRLMSGKWVVGQGLRISVEYLGALGRSAATAGREAPSVSTEPTAGRIVESGVDPHFFSAIPVRPLSPNATSGYRKRIS
jgi:hypothetical protein